MMRSLGAIEAVKWVAFVAMVVDHIDLIVFGRSQPWMYDVGRFAAPAFALCFGFGLGLTRDRLGVALRLIAPAIAAQALWIVAGHVVGLNILATFAACALVLATQPGWIRAVAVAVLSMVAARFEGGLLIMAVVFAGFITVRYRRDLGLLLVLPWLAVFPSAGAVAALLAVVAAIRVPIALPRASGALAWAYPAHLGLLLVVAAVLAARSAA